MSLLNDIFKRDELTQLNIGTGMSADCELAAPTGISMTDITSLENLLIGVKTTTGQIVTPERARRCSGVLACMRIISEDLSSLPIVLWKRVNDSQFGQYTERADNHPVYDILDSVPNEVMTPIEVREHMIFDMMLWGNFYNLKNIDFATGDISSIWPLQAGYVTRRWRELTWVYTDPLTGETGQFNNDMIWRGSMLSPNAMDGTAMILLAREAIGLLLAAEEQGARLFKYGIQTDFALESDGEIGNKDELRTALMQRHSGSGNAFLPLLLENGLKAGRIGLTAQESQYIEARKYQLEDIARIWRVPEVLLGSSTSGKSSTYASAEQFFNSYTKHTLGPWASRIEQTISRDLLTQKERSKYFAKHDFSSLLRGDTAARYASYATGIDKGFITPGFAARQENLPWKPELEYYNKPAPPAPGPDAEGKSAPTDQSAILPRRVAQHIIDKERKAVVGGKQDADIFYTHFGGYVEDLTGAAPEKVMSYLEMRRTTSDRFAPEAVQSAVGQLIGLCEKDK